MEKAKKAIGRKMKTAKKPPKTKSDGEKPKKVYIPGRSRDLKKDEELICDESAYTMLHSFDTVSPCLSFDPLPDKMGEKRDSYPAFCYLVTGTQAEKIRDNKIMVMKLTNLHKNKTKEKEKKDDDDEEESESSDSEDEEGEKPVLFSAAINHHGGINRIRSTQINETPICAVWNDQSKVQIWKIDTLLSMVDNLEEKIKNESDTRTDVSLSDEKPLFSFSGHPCEGYALDWSPMSLGKLLSGDNRKNIHLWTMTEGGQWTVDQRPFNAHLSSVEDIQWSPNEDNVFASCSSDKTMRLWDSRVPPHQACICTVENAHDGDVNVISWNPVDPLLVSGGDDCALKIWDLKFIQNGHPVANFKHHTKAITSVHWYKHDSTVFAAAGADNQVTIWDLAVEPDDEMEVEQKESEPSSSEKDSGEKVPPQLMFLHAGQEEIKEVRWHPQLCGTAISTALDGFNVFRPVNF
uniref:Glutamate-rich WD repeat-containing protein 1 n=1 Tax=Romanomermis culicivorax TaxID=13658 RepID=A0A915K635_ROMCU